MSKPKMSKSVRELVLSFFDESWRFPSQIYYSVDAFELRRLFPTFSDFVAAAESLADEGLLERGDGYYRYAYRRPLGEGGEEWG